MTGTSARRRKIIPKKVVDIGQSKLPYPFVYSHGGLIYRWDGSKKEEIKVARDIRLMETRQQIDDLSIEVILEFVYKGNQKRFSIPRELLADSRELARKLAQQGCDVYENNVHTVIKHLVNQEVKAPLSSTHQYVGWDSVEDKSGNTRNIFKCYKAAGFNSVYAGDLDIQPRGNFENWMIMIENEVRGNTPLEAAVIFGLSAPIIGLIGPDIDADAMVVHLYGDSTQGKTTASQLAISTFGNPATNANGLMRSWNATANALFGFLRNNTGLPIVLDEASMSRIKDLSNIIYKLASGRDKDRMNKMAEVKEIYSWNTTIISNGEFALTQKASQNAGIQMRVLEFGNIAWTRSAANAETIKASILKNHGWAGWKFVSRLIHTPQSHVISEYQGWVDKCFQTIEKKDRFTKRIANKLAILMVTADLANRHLSLGFDMDGLLDFLISAEARAKSKRDLGKKAYEYFHEQVHMNKSKFIKEYEEPLGSLPNRLECWGKLTRKENQDYEICIFPSKFNEIMTNGGFEDPDIILEKWRDMGLLNHEKDRLSRRRIINATSPQTVYIVYERDLDQAD